MQLSLLEETFRAKIERAHASEQSAQTERDALKREREELIQDKFALLQDAESAKREMDRWKAAVRRVSRHTVSSFADVITQAENAERTV